MTQSSVVSVSLDDQHNFGKKVHSEINLVEGFGIVGDAHYGRLVQHRFLQSQDPAQPNLRQVHLLDIELLTELQQLGHYLDPGDMGENITTKEINLVELPLGTLLHVGKTVVLEVTGLRNPCPLIEKHKPGLYKVFKEDGKVIRKIGIMSIVLKAGSLVSGNEITVDLPAEPYRELPFL